MNEQGTIKADWTSHYSEMPCRACGTTKGHRFVIAFVDTGVERADGESVCLCQTCLYLAVKDGVREADKRLGRIK